MAEEGDLSAQKRSNPLIVRPDETQIDVARRGNRIIARIASDALKSLLILAEKRWQVGDYQVSEQTYRQIMIWVDHLNSNGWGKNIEEFSKIQDANCPFIHDEYRRGKWIVESRITSLSLGHSKFTSLNLSGAPGLTYLYCRYNELTELDLASVPSLTYLDCSGNQLTELDLAGVPGLTYLDCMQNQLTELDLASVPGLTRLGCGINQLTELDLTSVPGLTRLDCGSNQLTELDLTSVLGLASLHCVGNQLTALDISDCPELEEVVCDPGVLVRKRPEQRRYQ